jgi:hypothetical protein
VAARASSTPVGNAHTIRTHGPGHHPAPRKRSVLCDEGKSPAGPVQYVGTFASCSLQVRCKSPDWREEVEPPEELAKYVGSHPPLKCRTLRNKFSYNHSLSVVDDVEALKSLTEIAGVRDCVFTDDIVKEADLTSGNGE